MDKRLAIDVGGSSIKYALMGEDHQILEQGKVPAPREVKEEFIEAVGQLYDRYAEQISGMGISMAGKVNPHTGYVVSAGSFPFFTGTNMIESLAKRCPTHITVDNDARWPHWQSCTTVCWLTQRMRWSSCWVPVSVAP